MLLCSVYGRVGLPLRPLPWAAMERRFIPILAIAPIALGLLESRRPVHRREHRVRLDRRRRRGDQWRRREGDLGRRRAARHPDLLALPRRCAGRRDQLGLAGAWRTSEDDIETVDDFYAAFALGTAFPLPPGEDELEHNDIPAGFVWGDVDTWVEAGTAFKLCTRSRACRPRRACTTSAWCSTSIRSTRPPARAATVCRRRVAVRAGQGLRRRVLRRRDVLGRRLPRRGETPGGLEVTDPPFDEYNAEVSQSDALTVRWQGEDPRGYRLVIRVWDDLGRMFTINAKDDGEYASPPMRSRCSPPAPSPSASRASISSASRSPPAG